MHGVHPPCLHRLCDSLERMRTHVAQLEGSAHQAPRAGCNHHLIGAGQPLQPCRQVGGLAHRELGFGVVRSRNRPDHHRPGGHSDVNGQRRIRAHRFHCLHDLQGRAHAALGIILVGAGPAKVGHQPIAPVLGHVPLVARHDFGARFAVALHQLAQFLGIEALRQRGGTYQVAEHHGELAPLGAL